MRKIVSLIIIVVVAKNSYAQGNSLYSQMGVGNFNPSTFQANFSQGGLSSTVNSKYFLNPSNPASYSKLKFTVGEFGVFNSNNFYSQGDSSANQTAFHLGNFGFAFPLSSKIGMAIGFMPYSRMNYSYKQKGVIFGDQLVTQKFEGSGNISNIFFGVGGSVGNLSLGGNAQYLFGEITKAEHLQFSSTEFLNIRNQKISVIRGFSANFGAQYELDLNEENFLRFGLQYQLGNSISADYYQKVNSYIIQTTTFNDGLVEVERHDAGKTIEDTEANPINSTLKLPHQYKGGVAFGKKGSYSIGLDYENGAFDGFKFQGDLNNYKRSQKLIMGFEKLPNEQAKGYENYLQSFIYRAGVNFGTSPIVVAGKQLNEIGINFGMGFPLKKTKFEAEKFGSYLFLSLGYDRLSGAGNTGINENYFKVNISAVLNDKWFVKRKFD